MSSPTLKHILNLWNTKFPLQDDDVTIVELPFGVELFCGRNDELVSTLVKIANSKNGEHNRELARNMLKKYYTYLEDKP